jgi:outer membrane protein
MKERSAFPQRIFSVLSILGLVIAFTVMLSPIAIAQQAAPSEQQEAEQPLDEEGLEPLPLSPIEKAEQDGTAIHLSLVEITKLALQNNIDIAIADTSEETSKLSLVSAEAAYDPSLSFSLSTDSSKSSNTRLETASSEATFTTSKSVSWSANYSQSVKTGGSIRGSMSTSRRSSDESFSLFNPSFNARASVTYSQPLWKNFMIDSNRAQLKIVKLDMEASDITFKQTVTTNISRIMQQYWALVSAIEDYDIQRNSMRLAMINLRDNRKRVEVGTQAPITITETEFQLAQTRQSLNSAEETIERQMNAMRQYISNDPDNEIWSKVIVPTDTPDFQEYRIDLDTAIETAMRNSPEVQQSDLDLQKSDINLKVRRNDKKWGVDLSFSFGSSGSSGTPGGSGQNLDLIDPDYIGGWGTSFDNLFSKGLINWSLQLSVDVPLRNRRAETSYANELISRKRTVLNRKKLEQQIVVEIRNAYQALQTARLQVETAKLRRELAEEQLDGENKRYDAGLTENYRVLERQDQLASAENGELRSLITYKNAIITLQEAMNTLLEESDFEISKGSSDNIPDLY